MKKLLAPGIFVALFSVSAASAANTMSAQELVRDTTDKVLAKLDAERAVIKDHPERIYDLVSEYVLPHFDFEAMARSVLGKYWRRADAKQRKRFTEEFRTLLVRTYASSLAEYDDEKVVYLAPRERGRGGVVTVRTEIHQKSGFPIPVDYDLRKLDGEWKVVGLTIDNLDLVLNYRTSFGNEIQRLGLDQVIENLAKRNQQASK